MQVWDKEAGRGALSIQQLCPENQARLLAVLGQLCGMESIDPTAAGRIVFSLGKRTTGCLQTKQAAKGVGLCAIRVPKLKVTERHRCLS